MAAAIFVEARSLRPSRVFGFCCGVVLMGFNLLSGEICGAAWGDVPAACGVASQASLVAHRRWPIRWRRYRAVVFYGSAAGHYNRLPVCAAGRGAGRAAGPRAFAVIMTGRNFGVAGGPGSYWRSLQQGYRRVGAVAPILAVITSLATVGALLLHVKYRANAHGGETKTLEPIAASPEPSLGHQAIDSARVP